MNASRKVRLPNRDDLIDAATAFATETPTVRGILLVGSYARGEFTPRSDVDLLVLTARSTDIGQDAVKEFFRSHLEQHGLQIQAVDVFVLDNKDLGPHSLFRRSAAHMRFLEADRGVPLWGEDFRSHLVPPPREAVLARVLDQVAELRDHPEEIDDRDVLLLATARMYAHTGTWPSKREASEWDQHPAVASAWQQRMKADEAPTGSPAYADYVRVVQDELEACAKATGTGAGPSFDVRRDQP